MREIFELGFNKKYKLEVTYVLDDKGEYINDICITYTGTKGGKPYTNYYTYPELEFYASSMEGTANVLNEQLKDRIKKAVLTLANKSIIDENVVKFLNSQVIGSLKAKGEHEKAREYEELEEQRQPLEQYQPKTEKKVDENTMQEMQMMKETLVEMQKTLSKGFEKINSNPYEQAIIDSIINKGKEITAESLKQDIINLTEQYVTETYGSLPKRIEIVNNKEVKKIEGNFHKDFEKVTKIVANNVPLMLVGRAGTGKNHTLEQVAQALGLEFYFSNAVTQEYTLKGFIDANGKFHETQFYKAFSQGGMFFLDEMDASIPESLIVLNSAIANGYFDFPIGRITKHENFRVVSACNTWGTGANAQYIGRNQLDGATLDRFITIEFDYDNELERSLVGNNEELYKYAITLRSAIDELELRYIVSMRAMLNANKLDGVLSTEEIVKSCFLKGMTYDDMVIIIKHIEGLGVKENKYFKAMKKIRKEMK